MRILALLVVCAAAVAQEDPARRLSELWRWRSLRPPDGKARAMCAGPNGGVVVVTAAGAWVYDGLRWHSLDVGIESISTLAGKRARVPARPSFANER